jgi:hypothetical protein
MCLIDGGVATHMSCVVVSTIDLVSRHFHYLHLFDNRARVGQVNIPHESRRATQKTTTKESDRKNKKRRRTTPTPGRASAIAATISEHVVNNDT